MSKEKQFLQLHLQTAIVTVVGASLKVVCGGAKWRGKKGVGGNWNGKNERIDAILLTTWNESGVCEYEGNHVDTERREEVLMQ